MKFSIAVLTEGRKGFTLVELLVVLGLFSSIMTMAVGALYTTQAANTKLQETQSVLDNVNLSMEIMTRDIRYGSEFFCSSAMPATTPPLRQSCEYSPTASGTVLFFKPSNASLSTDRVGYYVSNGTLFKQEFFNGMTTTYQITSNDVDVKSISFYVSGAYTSDGDSLLNVGGYRDYDQPLITLTLLGVTKPTKSSIVPTSFVLETSISARGQDR